MKTENYTYKDEFGELITIENIPSSEVDALMKANGCSRLEALDCWCYDHDKIGNAEADALTAKAKASGAGIRNKGNGKRKAPTRKPDMIKRALIADFADHLQSGIVSDTLSAVAKCEDVIDMVNVENVERIISFSLGDDTYTLTLAKKRKAK